MFKASTITVGYQAVEVDPRVTHEKLNHLVLHSKIL